MVFHAEYCHPNTRDVAKRFKSVKKNMNFKASIF